MGIVGIGHILTFADYAYTVFILFSFQTKFFKNKSNQDVKQGGCIMDDIQQTNQEQQQNSNTEGKTFTQDEVNRIVSERLNKEKGKINADREAEYSKREQELNQRELKLHAREALSERNMPSELLDVLNYSSKEDLDKCIDVIEQVLKNQMQQFQDKLNEKPEPRIVIPGTGRPLTGGDPIRSAMGLK